MPRLTKSERDRKERAKLFYEIEQILKCISELNKIYSLNAAIGVENLEASISYDFDVLLSIVAYNLHFL